ncbi:MAG: sigma-70 family RNA polymerase sigma factor, partial [Burkholderiales bacterium]
LGRHPTDQEVADHCELSIDEYHQTLDTMVGMTAFDEVPEHLLPIADGADPSQINSFRQISERLAQVIKELPEKERMVVALHYQEDLSFREVATVLDLTPGRISQIHTQAMLRIRSVLGTDPSFR